ncbi:MAG: hypothetical protein JWR11_4970 [Mycobacterium sp.]|nr:hypothetical protein [Mycobacterium sp.]MDT5178910.1 hypothetical protein [Mycobacterium sp.]
MSVLTLPEPANWPAGGRRVWRFTLVFVAIFVIGVVVSAHRALLGDYVAAFFAIALLAPVTLLVVALQLVSRGRTSLRAGQDGTGTTLRTDRTFSTLTLTTFGVYIPLGIAFVVFSLTGDLEVFASERARIAATVLMVFVVGTLITGLIGAWRRGGIGYVELKPSGLDIANIKSTESVAWADVADVADHSEVTKKTRNAVVLRLRDGTEKTIDGADFYVPRGVGLYWMVRHYWRHADDRVELTDARALQRLDEGRFDLT